MKPVRLVLDWVELWTEMKCMLIKQFLYRFVFFNIVLNFQVHNSSLTFFYFTIIFSGHVFGSRRYGLFSWKHLHYLQPFTRANTAHSCYNVMIFDTVKQTFLVSFTLFLHLFFYRKAILSSTEIIICMLFWMHVLCHFLLFNGRVFDFIIDFITI